MTTQPISKRSKNVSLGPLVSQQSTVIGGTSLTVTDWKDFNWSQIFLKTVDLPGEGKVCSISWTHQLSPAERWMVKRIYVDRHGPGKDNPIDWGDVRILISTPTGGIFEAHLTNIGRILGDLGDKIAKLLDENEPEELLRRLSSKEEPFIVSRIVGVLQKPILLERASEFSIRLEGTLLQDVRICFAGIRGLDVQ